LASKRIHTRYHPNPKPVKVVDNPEKLIRKEVQQNVKGVVVLFLGPPLF